jgi:hypothetical protein
VCLCPASFDINRITLFKAIRKANCGKGDRIACTQGKEKIPKDWDYHDETGDVKRRKANIKY